MADFNNDDIVCAYEIPGVYDGTSVYLLKSGEIVNRWDNGFFPGRYKATQKWIEQHANHIRAEWADQLEGGE